MHVVVAIEVPLCAVTCIVFPIYELTCVIVMKGWGNSGEHNSIFMVVVVAVVVVVVVVVAP